MTTYMKLVKGATKIKMAPPKQKYVEPIILGTADPGEFREVVRALETRISDTAWTVVYKTLIVVHLMMREGERNVAIRYFSTHLSFFELSEIERAGRWASADLRALERYDRYLQTRCEEFDVTGVDYVREGYSGLKSVSGSGGVRRALDHVGSLETQIRALIRNRYSQTDLSNELLLCGFRLLVQDLLSLYKCLNEGIITLLESFFELTRADAQRTLELYRTFVGLTDDVVKYLKSGKSVGMKIPVIKHITTKLIRSLEEHLREDEKTHTFSKDTPESSASIAQKKLEQIRKQKQLLEQQLQNQQLLVSPTVQQQPYNPFGVQQQPDTFTFEQQPTGNPFLSANTVPQQATGFYSTNQVTPAFTGAGFGGYSSTQPAQPSRTGSNNPFTAEPAAQHDLLNPFTQPNLQPQPQPQMQNPFQQPLVSAQTAPSLAPATTYMGMTQQGTGYNQMGMQQQGTGYNPFQLQPQQLQAQQMQQQQMQLQQQQQMYSQNPNLIDI